MVLEVNGLSKSFGNQTVLNNISLKLYEGTTLSIIGPSGSGKSTLLKILSNRLPFKIGNVYFQKKLLQPKPNKPHKGMVYLSQEPLLFPHLSLEKNISFGLSYQNLSKTEIKSKALNMINLLELEEVTEVPVSFLSGGQKQRVALGRAILTKPTLLLLDEPFSALDHFTRRTIQKVYQKLSSQFSITSILVTHDIKEALFLGDHFAKLDKGALKNYQSKQDFIDDPLTGAHEEINYWKAIVNEK